jgi:hypothetical protein
MKLYFITTHCTAQHSPNHNHVLVNLEQAGAELCKAQVHLGQSCAKLRLIMDRAVSSSDKSGTELCQAQINVGQSCVKLRSMWDRAVPSSD